MTPIQIVFDLQLKTTQGDKVAELLFTDAVRASLNKDWDGLAYIANIASGQSSSKAWQMSDLRTIAELIEAVQP